MGIIEHRRALHQIPELDRQLPKTLDYIRQHLHNCALFTPAQGSLCAYFDFGKAQTLAFRSDMDALPIGENTGLPFASCHPGRMHACGHDGHMAILLELARRLGEQKSCPNNILLIFQCAEETTGGARPICESGVLEEYRVKAVFGLHLWPGLPAGELFSRPGPMMAGSCEVDVEILGHSAHIAKSAEGADALAAGLEIYRRAGELEANLGNGCLLKFGKMESGSVRNAVSDKTRLEGSLRAFEPADIAALKQGLEAVCRQAVGGCTATVSFSEGSPAVVNDSALFVKIRQIAPVRELSQPVMTAEDFSCYQQRVPGLFLFLGLGDGMALHSDRFDFDETILTKGADFFEKLAKERL